MLIEQVALKNKVRVSGSAGPSYQGDRNSEREDRNPRGSDRSGGGKGRGRERHAPKKEAITGRESSHGAILRPKAPISVEEMFEGIDANTRGVWLALDTLQDPQNLGAIFRSAGFFGIKGIIMTSERFAPMTSTVYDISSGGVEAVPYVPVINLQRAFEVAKESGLWILGTSEHAKQSMKNIKNDRPWLIVVGNEEKGIRRLTEEACDMMTVIPCKPNAEGEKVVTSLNVSVATGILLSHFS